MPWSDSADLQFPARNVVGPSGDVFAGSKTLVEPEEAFLFRVPTPLDNGVSNRLKA